MKKKIIYDQKQGKWAIVEEVKKHKIGNLWKAEDLDQLGHLTHKGQGISSKEDKKWTIGPSYNPRHGLDTKRKKAEDVLGLFEVKAEKYNTLGQFYLQKGINSVQGVSE